MFSLERLWVKFLALKGFGLVGLEYKAKKVFRLQIRFLASPSLGDRVMCGFGVGGSLPYPQISLQTKSQPPIMPWSLWMVPGGWWVVVKGWLREVLVFRLSPSWTISLRGGIQIENQEIWDSLGFVDWWCKVIFVSNLTRVMVHLMLCWCQVGVFTIDLNRCLR